MPTYYEILDIEESATTEKIKENFRLLSHIYHPDKIQSDDPRIKQKGKEKFQEIYEAYKVLSDTEKRRQYDEQLMELRDKQTTVSTGYSSVSGRGVPKLEISKTSFNFSNIRAGASASDSFTVSNVGGGTLSGTITTNKKWLKVSQSSIDTVRHKQDVSFYIDTSGLPFGLKDTAAIEIQSNGGVERIPVNLSVEAPEADLDRFRSGLTIGSLILGGLFGFLIFKLSFLQGMNANVAGIAGIAALIGSVIVSGKLAAKESVGFIFGFGCGTLIIGFIILAILEKYFPHALSTVAWSLVYGSLANISSASIRNAFWRGNKAVPISIGTGVNAH